MTYLHRAGRTVIASAILGVVAASLSAALPFPLKVPAGFRVELVSQSVPGARFLAVAPNGDVIVSQVSQGRVVAVRPGSSPDTPPRVVAEGLERPNGLAFRGNDLYIATWTGVVVIPGYPNGIGSPRTLFDDMPRNADHNNRALALAPDGSIFISSGSDCNVCTEDDPRLATIMHYSADGRNGTMYASGLRNASGLAFDRQGRLWAVVNQRDNLLPDHTNLPPEELDLVQQGGNYGWPTCYPDGARRLPNPEFPDASCQNCLPATMNMQAHSAPLQAEFYNGTQFPARYRGALFIAFQGSWNRQPRTGYKVVAVTFADGKPTGIEDFVTGWLTDTQRVFGHPIGVTVDGTGSLYVCDDTGNLLKITYTG